MPTEFANLERPPRPIGPPTPPPAPAVDRTRRQARPRHAWPGPRHEWLPREDAPRLGDAAGVVSGGRRAAGGPALAVRGSRARRRKTDPEVVAEQGKNGAHDRHISRVHNPTLTVRLPPPRDKATGAAVVILPRRRAPHSLAIDHEGYDVAHVPQQRSVWRGSCSSTAWPGPRAPVTRSTTTPWPTPAAPCRPGPQPCRRVGDRSRGGSACWVSRPAASSPALRRHAGPSRESRGCERPGRPPRAPGPTSTC